MNSASAQALGSALFHFVWQGAVIALLLAATVRLTRRSSARVRYVLACSALFSMPVVFGVTFWLSLPEGNDAATWVSPALTPPVWHGFIGSSGFVARPVRNGAWWLVPLWMAGVCCLYSYKLAGWIVTQRLRRIGVCGATAFWQDRLFQLSGRLRLSKPVVLLESCLTDTPVVIGHFRPVILAPLGILTGLPTEQVESILIHELAHIRRHDYAINLAQSITEGLLFYHPAVWWISAMVRTEREFCCDDIVIACGGDARSYAQALGALEQHRKTAGETALAANGGNLMRRIRRLLHQPQTSRYAAGPAIGLLLASACIALAAWQPNAQVVPRLLPIAPQSQEIKAPGPLIAQARPQQAPAPAPPAPARLPQLPVQAPPASPATGQAATPYEKWLDQEVGYIITEEERQAFSRLQTDDERQAFILQFWLRRDPTPVTAENEFREELYRRIAWSNDRYSANGTLGWKTDRGRIYISYGPPDTVDIHTSGAAPGFPGETWTYRFIQGIGGGAAFEFVDQSRNGDYRLTIDPTRGLRRVERVF